MCRISIQHENTECCVVQASVFTMQKFSSHCVNNVKSVKQFVVTSTSWSAYMFLSFQF